jgi:PKD repeat protein
VSAAIGVLLVAATGPALLLLGTAEAQAVITEPIPADVGPAPPAITALPAAGDTAPPPAAIADPITPEATCGAWYRQGNYGDRWPAGSPWWEYQCTRSDYYYYNNCTTAACDAFCPGCYGEAWEWTDYFYWDPSRSDAVFYGESYSYSLTSEGYYWPPYLVSYWWDAPTARWYNLSHYWLTVSKHGTGSGTVTSSPAGISCGDSCEASFDADTLVTLTATPDASSTFSGWSGPCSGTGSCQVTMDQARSVTATFAAKAFTLTVGKDGTGSGTVSSSPAGISCGDSCQASFDAGTLVTLTATPDASSTFSGWSDPCSSGPGSCQVTMDQARSMLAIFDAKPFTLSVSKDGTGSGTVSSSPAGISCGDSCEASFDADTLVTLTATPDASSTFSGWSGPCSSGTGSCQVTMDQADSVTATFEANPPPVVSPPPPTFISTPDDYSSDSTPTWDFSGEPGATFTCTLIKPFVGAWDGGGDGTQPQPDNVTVDARACDSGSYTFDLTAGPDGTYVLWVTQSDGDGNTSTPATDSFVLQRTVSQNAAPQARLAFGCAARSCSFDGTASSDADGTIVAYAWDFGDGGSGSGATAEYTYTEAGSHTVTLTVTDEDGSSATDSKVVTVEASVPLGQEDDSTVAPPPQGQGVDASLGLPSTPHAAIMHCKKRFPQGPKRKGCIKRAKKLPA